MDEALVADMRGLIENSSTVHEVLERIILEEEDGPEMVRLLLVGAATANAEELSDQRPAGFYFIKGAVARYKAREGLDNRRVIRHLVRTIDEIGSEVYREVEDESEFA